jgi:pimeloyl-ACP methyl ester carboxylesterase
MESQKSKSLILSLIIVCAFSLAGFSQSNNSNSKTKPTVIFVHGLWTDGSAWNKVTALLQAQGYPVISVQNPTTSLESDVAATNNAIARAKGDVVIVGHSWGGMVITEAGIAEKVKALVYITALAPEKGESVGSLSSKFAATKVGNYIQNTGGFLTLSEQGFKLAFADDLSVKDQKLIFSTQPPTLENIFAEVAKNEAWKIKPSYYLVTRTDKALHPELQRMLAKRAKAFTVEVDASHVPMLSKPEAVFNIIKEALKKVK